MHKTGEILVKQGKGILCQVSILPVILHYSFAKCYHWEKPGKTAQGIPLHYFL